MKKLSVVLLVSLLVSMVTYGQEWRYGTNKIYAYPKSSTKLGIGVTSPISKLHVQCNAYGPINPENRSAIYGYNTSTDVSYANSIGVYGRVKTSKGMAIYGYSQNSDGYAGYFEGRGYFSGNVGIGTPSPHTKLYVRASTVNDFDRDNYADMIVEGEEGRLELVSNNLGNNAAAIILTDVAGANDNRKWFLGTGTSNVNNKLFIGYTTSTTDINQTGNADMTITTTGDVGIGTTNPQSKLAVNGTITAKKVTVTLEGWPDFVFADNYKLMPLDKLEKHIKVNNSLPGIPKEKDVVESGVDLGEMQAKLLEKVEELTLYVIEQNKKISELEEKIARLEAEN